MNLNEAVELAAKDLPGGYIITLEIENGAAWIELVRPDGIEWGFADDIDGADRTLAEQIKYAMDIAIEMEKKLDTRT